MLFTVLDTVLCAVCFVIRKGILYPYTSNKYIGFDRQRELVLKSRGER